MRSAAAMLLLLVALPARAQDGAPPLMLRRTVSSQGPVWVGQRVTVTLTAMTPVRFVAPPDFPDLVAQGRAVVLPEATTVPGVERVGGQSLAALQRSYTLFPAEVGELVLPPLSMMARVGGPDGQPLEAVATVTGTRIGARVPPGVADLTRLLVAPELRIVATLDRSPEALRVGEAITRTVRIEARDVAAMLLPPALWGSPPGVSVYPDPPVLQDRLDRGELRASRTDRAAFVPQRPGKVELPGFSVTWLDPRSGGLREETVAPIRFEALPVADGTEATAGPLRRLWPWAAAVLAAATAIGALTWRHRRRQVRDPSRQAFDVLMMACRADDARAALPALFRWCDAAMPPAGGEGGIERLAVLARTPGLLAAARALEERLYAAKAADGAWNGEVLGTAARAARGKLRQLRDHRRPQGLPELNPHGAARPSPRVVLRHWAR